MQLDRALAQLSEIHAQILRAEVYRGYRARSCMATATLAVLAGAAQSHWQFAAAPADFALFWSLVGVACALIGMLDLWLPGAAPRESLRRSATVLGQLAPALLVGAALPWLLLRVGGDAPALLPGMWSTLFGLAMFASRPYLPRAIGWVAATYVGFGVWLLANAPHAGLSPWSVALPFGIGQCGSAVVLWLQLERRGGET